MIVKDKDLHRSTIPENQIKQSVSSSLRYACVNQWTHLIKISKKQAKTHEKQIIGLFDYFIHCWAECIAWLGKLKAVKSLQKIEISQQVS
jgi:hypothetical protein